MVIVMVALVMQLRPRVADNEAKQFAEPPAVPFRIEESPAPVGCGDRC